MPKFKVGDEFSYTNQSPGYKVVALDDAAQVYVVTLKGHTYKELYRNADANATLVSATWYPAFKVGDVITSVVTNTFALITVIQVGTTEYTLQDSHGPITVDMRSVDKNYTLVSRAATATPNPLPPFAQAIANSSVFSVNGVTVPAIVGTTGPNSPHLKEKPKDLYIGKLYKVMEDLVSTAGAFYKFKKGDTLIVKCVSLAYNGEYELMDYNNKLNMGILSLSPYGYTWMNSIKEYTAPSCTCGLTKTYKETHRREPPKHAHYNWCDISKE